MNQIDQDLGTDSLSRQGMYDFRSMLSEMNDDNIHNHSPYEDIQLNCNYVDEVEYCANFGGSNIVTSFLCLVSIFKVSILNIQN